MNATAETTLGSIPPASPAGDTLGLVDGLLRDRSGLLDRIAAGADLATLARAMTLTIAISAAVFGATLGYYRGGLQILYAAVKLPLVVLLTAALATPAFSALSAAFAGRTDVRRDFALVLSSLALASLLIVATAPLVLLAEALHLSYHRVTLLVVACCAAGGVGGLTLFFAGLRRRELPSRALVAALLLGTFCAVGGQMAWTLRPYLVRPRSVSVPFVRGIEGGFLDAVYTSADSARGLYHRDAAPIPGQPADESPEQASEPRESRWEVEP